MATVSVTRPRRCAGARIGRRRFVNSRLSRSSRAPGSSRAALVYGIIGVLALDLALGHGGKITNQQGALQHGRAPALRSRSARARRGRARRLRALAALPRRARPRPRGRRQRARAARRARQRDRLRADVRDRSPDPHRAGHVREAAAKKTASDVFGWPAGRWLVGARRASCWPASRSTSSSAACGRSSSTTRRPSRCRTHLKPWFTALGTVGHVARAVVFGLVGVFLIKAAIDYKANEAIGLDGALGEALRRRLRLVAARRRRRRTDRLRVLLARSKRATGASVRLVATSVIGRPDPSSCLAPCCATRARRARHSGSRQAHRARSRSSATARRPSRSKAITTPCSSSTTSTPARITPYEVRLDGELAWPPEDGRPAPGRAHSQPRAPRAARLRLVPRWRPATDEPRPRMARRRPRHRNRRALDVLRSSSSGGDVEWPDAVLLLGDQVYADEVSPETLAFIREQRGTDQPPGEQIADFEEYTRLYRESWSEPDIRWLFSTVPTVMIFDDHDVHDDWNISWLWVEEMRRTPWWEAASPARSCPTGSTSISATSPRPSSRRTRRSRA